MIGVDGGEEGDVDDNGMMMTMMLMMLVSKVMLMMTADDVSVEGSQRGEWR